MTDHERSVIGLALTDLRSGVRPFDTEGIDSNNTSTSPKSYDVSYNPNGYRLVPPPVFLRRPTFAFDHITRPGRTAGARHGLDALFEAPKGGEIAGEG